MLVVYIVIGIAIIAAALLFCPISIAWQYDKKASLTVRYFFFKLPLLQKKEKQKTKPTQKKSRIKEYFNKNGFVQMVSDIFKIISAFADRSAWLFRKLKFKNLQLDIIVASENAAHTAVEYGAVCAAVYPAVAFVSSVAKTDIKQLDITADFDKDKCSITTSGKLECRLIWAIVAVSGLIISLVKNKIINIQPNDKEGTKNG